jgi:hypothetical protein
VKATLGDLQQKVDTLSDQMEAISRMTYGTFRLPW